MLFIDLTSLKFTDFNLIQFILFRLYKERIKEIDDKLIEVRLGTAKEYRIPLQLLQEQMKTRLDIAAILKKFKVTNLKHKFESDDQSIIQNFEVIF